jgi:hypothetical protein
MKKYAATARHRAKMSGRKAQKCLGIQFGKRFSR